jgi:hypothetical protein
MFKMIGGDGQEYGPATVEELSAWILDHRANGDTQVQAEGSPEWRPLSSFPDFADVLRQAYPAPPVPAVDYEGAAAPFRSSDLADDIPFNLGDILGRAWALLGRHFFLIIGACAVVWLILTVGAFATCVGGLLSLVLAGALHGGLMLVYLRLIRGQPASIGTVFSCFGPLFLPLMLVSVVTQILSQLGLVFCLIPGLFLKVIWTFALPLVADRGLDFWPALERSRRAVLRHFLKVAALLLIAFLPLLVFEFYGVWRTVTFFVETLGPTGAWTLDTIRAKQDEIGEFVLTLSLQEQLVVLLSMPFGYAALLQAYEHIFHPRRVDGGR